LRAAYCADTELPVRLLGGATFPRKVLRRWPDNWEVLPFDSIAVSDFLSTLDFFVHYTHPAYVEEFGRNIMEAMAAGIPSVVPPRFREVFGYAACYAEPELVEDRICTLWCNHSAYAAQVEQGFEFVREFASNEPVERRLRGAIDGAI
jgi:glycosyltransferase involved in cell wall biosynthesis